MWANLHTAAQGVLIVVLTWTLAATSLSVHRLGDGARKMVPQKEVYRGGWCDSIEISDADTRRMLKEIEENP